MRIRFLLPLLLFLAPALRTCTAFQVPPSSAGDANPSQNRLWLIPHTHWEGAVFKTREEYLEEDLPNILEALHLMRAFPEYRFVLDQVAYVKPFLERYPDQAEELQKLIHGGWL